MFKSKAEKRFFAHEALIRSCVSDVEKELLNALTELFEPLGRMDFETALSYTTKLDHIISIFQKSIDSYVNTSVRELFEKDHHLFISLERVEEEKKAVLKWLMEIQATVRDLKDKMQLKQPNKVYYGIKKLQNKIGVDNEALIIFKSTLTQLQSEYIMHNTRPIGAEMQAFNIMHLHPLVRSASETFFAQGHYDQAVFGSFQALMTCVKGKVKITTASETSLIQKVFSINYDYKTGQIHALPILQINSLSNINDLNEQDGFFHLFLGLSKGVRNPIVHKSEIIKQVNDPWKALEYLALMSLLAKYTDVAYPSDKIADE